MPLDHSRNSNSKLGDLAWKLLEFLSSKRPSVQEKLGHRRLDAARDLTQRYQDILCPAELRLAREKVIFVEEMRIKMESMSGLPRFLQARQYRKCAKMLLTNLKFLSDKGWPRDEMLEQRPVGSNSMLLATDGGIDVGLCMEMRPNVSTLVEHLYPFKTDKAPESIRFNVELAKMLLRDMNFIYLEAQDHGKRHSPYGHPIIQESINVTLFRDKDDVGIVHPEHFSPMPIPVIALILTVVQCCISEWSDGQRKDSSWNERTVNEVYSSHVSSLLSFQEQGFERNIDVLCQLQCDLLRNAREHAGVPQ